MRSYELDMIALIEKANPSAVAKDGARRHRCYRIS
jgi:hypothetical protein